MESWEELTCSDSWALTAWILLNKVMFFISKGPYYVVFNKNEIYWPISFIDKLYSDSGLLSNRKFDLEDLYLNINQCILILMKNYII